MSLDGPTCKHNWNLFNPNPCPECAKERPEAASPFIGETRLQWAWDSTSLGWLKTCPRLYQYSMIEGWRAKHTKIDLAFGIEYHWGIENYDRRRLLGEDHETALHFVVREVLARTYQHPDFLATDDTLKTRPTLIRSLVWYLEEFKEDNAKTIILANGKPAVELSFRMSLDWGPAGERPYALSGHIDRMVEFAGQIFVMDHKTTKMTLSASYFSQFEPDNQMSLYTLASQIVWSTPTKGVIIDAAQIAVGFTKFDRAPVYRTTGQLDEWMADLHIYLAQNEQYVRDNYWPMNDKACRLCVFKKICSKDPEVRHIFLKSDFKKLPWNPLAVR